MRDDWKYSQDRRGREPQNISGNQIKPNERSKRPILQRASQSHRGFRPAWPIRLGAKRIEPPRRNQRRPQRFHIAQREGTYLV